MIDALIARLRFADFSTQDASRAWWNSLSRAEQALIKPHMRFGDHSAEDERRHIIEGLERMQGKAP